MLHDGRSRSLRLINLPPLSRQEAAENTLKEINHEMCMQMLALSETNARWARLLLDQAPHLHDELVHEIRDMNRLALGEV